ncbi:MAG: fluoride efflux transporter CrcB [Actinomycetes bacterium]
MLDVLLVAVGAAAGGPARFLTDRVLASWREADVFPWGTFTVNVVGSFILGLLAGGVARHGVSHDVMILVGTGFCGALTTFSSFGYETMRLVEAGAYGAAGANVVGNTGFGLLAAALGWVVAGVLW